MKQMLIPSFFSWTFLVYWEGELTEELGVVGTSEERKKDVSGGLLIVKTLSKMGEEGMTGYVGFSREPLLTENLDKTWEKELHYWHPSWSSIRIVFYLYQQMLWIQKQY